MAQGVVAHLGSGTETTVLEIAEQISHRLGGVPVEHLPARVGDVTRSVSDISRPGSSSGSAPSRPDWGLDRTVAWFQESGG